MKQLKLRIILGLVLIPNAALIAQEAPSYGCHYFRSGRRPVPEASAADRTQIAETIARSDTFDIRHYDIHLDVTNYGGGTIKGGTTVSFAAKMDGLDRIRFDLYDLTVDSVRADGAPVPFAYDGEFLDITLPDVMNTGDEAALSVYYHGDPHQDPEWGGFYFESQYIYNLGIGISTIPPNFGKVWYPCFDSFVERASYTYHVKSAGTYRFLGQGNFIEEVQLAGDTVIRTYDLPQEIPTYISAIAVANYQEHAFTHSGAQADIPVTLRAKPADLPGMISRFGNLVDAIDACEYWYGAYPYDRVGYVLTTDGALEIPTNVAYPQFMTGQTNASNRGLYTHELGHHWWGDKVSPFVHNDMWLKEGPAEYSGHLIEEWIGGQAGLLAAVKNNHYRVLREAHLDDDGFQPLSPMPDPHIYGTHTYYKGASVMHNLRGYLGDELFRQGMRGVQQSLGENTMTPEQFRDSLEAATGVQLDAFFDAWVFAPGYSVFVLRSWTSVAQNDSFLVELDLQQKLRGTDILHQDVPLEISFLDVNRNEYIAQVMAGGQFSTHTITVPFDPATVIVNRYDRINQARTTNERILIPGVSFGSTQPYVDMIMYQTALVDTTLVRIEHIWSGADQEDATPDVTQVSNTHYWDIGGLWPEGTILRGRFTYAGATDDKLDFDLVSGDETGMLMVYRGTPLDPWTPYPDQTVLAGDLFNGSGIVNLDVMRRGQYAFAKSSIILHTGDVQEMGALELFPVPANEHLQLRLPDGTSGRVRFDVIDAQGKLAMRAFRSALVDGRAELSVAELAQGTYLLSCSDAQGTRIASRRFVIER
ncbi:MAG: M1 family aminopeptidase [Flavobacteriales bacterium]